MNEKIRLKDNTEFTLIPCGIETRDKYRIFKFISELPFEELKAKFSGTNIQHIDYILADNNVYATYEDCVAFKSLAYIPDFQIDDNNVADIYVVVLSIDPIERQLQEQGDTIDAVFAAVDTLLAEILPMIMV